MNTPLKSRQGMRLILLCLSLASATALAQVSPRVGTVLSPSERTSLQSQPPVSVGQQQVRVLSVVAPQANGASRSANPTTLVVNADGVVGQSDNIVMISRLPTSQVQSRAARWISQAVSVQYYEHMNITMLRFATFSDAVAARTALEQALPEAGVALPIQYTAKKGN